MALLLALVMAQDLRAWQGLHEGLLMESADGDVTKAVAWYQSLLSGMSPEDPSYAELQYYLARALYEEGDAEGARRALKVAMADPLVAQRAAALMGQIDAQELQVHNLPVSWTFDTGTSHWLHAWRFGDKGAVSTAEPGTPGDPALAWTTTVTDGEDDAVQVFFSGVAPSEIRLGLRASAFPAAVALALEDSQGRLFYHPSWVKVPTTEFVEVRVLVRDFTPSEGSVAGGPLRPEQIRALALQDVTAFLSSDRGANTIFIDNASVR